MANLNQRGEEIHPIPPHITMGLQSSWESMDTGRGKELRSMRSSIKSTYCVPGPVPRDWDSQTLR